MNSRLVILLLLAFSSAFGGEGKLKTEVAEFICEKAPFRECHASTIVDLRNGDLFRHTRGQSRDERHPRPMVCHSAGLRGQGRARNTTAGIRLPDAMGI